MDHGSALWNVPNSSMSNGEGTAPTRNEVAGSSDRRYAENQVIRMFKGDEIPLSRRTITKAVDERLKIEKDFALIGRFLAEKRVQVNGGRKELNLDMVDD